MDVGLKRKAKDIVKKDIRNWMGHLLEVGYKPKTVGNNLGGLINAERKSMMNGCKLELESFEA